ANVAGGGPVNLVLLDLLRCDAGVAPFTEAAGCHSREYRGGHRTTAPRKRVTVLLFLARTRRHTRRRYPRPLVPSLSIRRAASLSIITAPGRFISRRSYRDIP